MNFKTKICSVVALILSFVSIVPAFATPTDITVQTFASIQGTIAAGAFALTMTAVDNANGNTFTATGREFIVVDNTDTVAQTITLTSVADSLGRTGDITAYSVPAAGHAVIGPFPTSGWRNGSGKVAFMGSAATLKVAVVKVPYSL